MWRSEVATIQRGKMAKWQKNKISVLGKPTFVVYPLVIET
jgi:hypothetical protein